MYDRLNDIVEDNPSFSAADRRRQNLLWDRMMFRYSLSPIPRNPTFETKTDYLFRSIKHYTSKNTILNALEYIGTFLKK